MTVKEVLDLAKIRLVNVPVSKTNASLIALINLGVSVLYDQFNLSIKSETDIKASKAGNFSYYLACMIIQVEN